MSKVLYGRKRELILPNGEKRTAQFAIVDLDEIIASHNENTFASSAGYPTNEQGRNINDRNYQDDPSAQRNVLEIAQNLNPESLIELSSKPAGTPIISKEGFVVSGNNRTMSLKLAVKRFPENYERYKQYLAKEIDVFGFDQSVGTMLLLNEKIPLPGSSYNDPQNVQFNHPVLVRIDEDIPDLTTTELAKYNLDTKKGERPVDRLIKLSNILRENDRCRQVVITIIDGYETFSELFGAGQQPAIDRKKLLQTFLDCGLITEAKVPDYYTDGQFTEAGKDFIENILASIILDPDALKVAGSEGVKRFRQILIVSLPVLIANANLPEGSLKPFISEAVLVQYRMQQVGGFNDYLVNQALFDETLPLYQSMVLNRLLEQGRNKFKDSILRYNEGVKSNSGSSLFGEIQLTPDQVFEKTIAAAIPEDELRLIKKKFGGTAMSKTTKIPVTIQEETLADLDLFANDAFFKKYPDKILGTPYTASGRFGQVTKYKGDIDVLDRIDAPVNFLGDEKLNNDALLSIGEPSNVSMELNRPDVEAFIRDVNKKSEQAVAQILNKRQRKKAVVVEDENILTTQLPELQTFEDIFTRHNPEISTDELEVFLWFKTQIGKPLSRRWARLIDPAIGADHLREPYHYQVTDEKKVKWIKEGKIYFFQESWVPAALYLSGDIYDRKFQLERDSYEIIEKYGQEVYDQQLKAIQAIFDEKHSRRLVIRGPEADTGLVILPNSKFADTFLVERISSIPEDGNFRMRKVTASTAKRYGSPDFLKDFSTPDNKKVDFKQLSLKNAFAYWIVTQKPDLIENVSHIELIKFYILDKPMRTNLNENASEAKKAQERAQFAKLKSSLQKEAERLFSIFLADQLIDEDKERLENAWNAKYNNYVPVNFNKIPVAFTMTRFYKGKPEELRPEKREAVAFNLVAGAACLAYDVGVGKTPSAIFTISAFMDAGYCKRPFVCVPNQVYKQFISEIKAFVPQIPVIEAYNLSEKYLENFKNADGVVVPVPEYTITVMTYEGLEQIGFNDTTYNRLFSSLYDILNQGGENEREKSERQEVSFKQRLQTLLGKGLRKSIYNIEDFGFDFATYDEAHRLKKIFTAVKGEIDSTGETATRHKSPYVINSGQPSSIGLKAFMLNQYILKENNYQNISLLTATPFTNSPLEIFSMMAMIAYEQLQNTDLNNIKNFFDTYIKTTIDLVINPRLKPEFKQVILGFNNLISLQSLIRRYINYKTGEDVNVQRPQKYVLPYLHKMVNGTIINLDESERVESYLPMTPQQESWMNDIIAYVEGKIQLKDLKPSSYQVSQDSGDQTDDKEISSEGEEIDEENLSETEKIGVRSLRAINLARSLALSPYLYPYSGLGYPTYYDYVESSPKLKYCMECIKTVKAYHEDRNEPVSGQIIYMDRGVQYFELLAEYLVKEVGYQPHEVGFIRGGMPPGFKKGSKEYVKNLFNGERYNEDTMLFEEVPDHLRIKVALISSSAKEGANLQRYTSNLYKCWEDFNPSDDLQLQGRIWRQGNMFNAIRIVHPLVINSIDIFIFQKLQEKTSRLNSIWASDGRTNVFKLEEFDPSELKYALMRDPETIAQLKIVDEKAQIDSDILGISRLEDRAQRLIENIATINTHFAALLELADTGSPFAQSNNKYQDTIRLMEIANQYIRMGREIKPSWFSDVTAALRNIDREAAEFLQPNNINISLTNINDLQKYIEARKKEIATLEKEKSSLDSPQYLSKIVKQISQEREKQKVSYKSLMQAVTDFTKLNYLLSDRKVVTTLAKPMFDSCPPMANGERLITDEAISFLDTCIEREPDTKLLYTDESGQYTAERQQLHAQIVADEFKHVRCIKRGKPIAVFTGGSPGSGKSKFLEKHADYLLSPDIFHLDADQIRTALPDYKGWNATVTHRETQDIVNDLLEKLGDGNCRYDFIYDGTMNKAQKYFKLIQRVKAMGYETFIIFMDVPYGIAKKRVLDRYKHTGRFVPSVILDEFFEQLSNGKTRGKDALDQLKSIVDGYVVVDGVTGKVIEEGGKTLPADRHYGDFLQLHPVAEPEPVKEVSETKAPIEIAALPENMKEQAKAEIKALQISVKYLKGAEKRQAQEEIKALKIAIKYL